MRIEFRRPSLGWLIIHQALPDELRELASAEWASPGAGARSIAADVVALRDPELTDEQTTALEERIDKTGADLYALYRELCAEALIEPKRTAAELDDPYLLDDIEMLAGFITGTVHEDAAGRCVGVVPLSDLATFRHHHRCDPDCKDCTASRRDLSTAHVGDL
jgi:hypothetical protein